MVTTRQSLNIHYFKWFPITIYQWNHGKTEHDNNNNNKKTVRIYHSIYSYIITLSTIEHVSLVSIIRTTILESYLTHRDRDKNAAISQTPLSKALFLNENVKISIGISLKCFPKVRINNITPLVQIMPWRRPGDKPLSDPMMARLPTHICVTRLSELKSSDCNSFKYWADFNYGGQTLIWLAETWLHDRAPGQWNTPLSLPVYHCQITTMAFCQRSNRAVEYMQCWAILQRDGSWSTLLTSTMGAKGRPQRLHLHTL